MDIKKQFKVMLVDDHVLLRESLAGLINSFEECHVVAVAGNGVEVIEELKRGTRPNLVVLDLNMPLMDGYETAKWLQEFHPKIKILTLTMYDSEIALIRLLQIGVRGFLKKDVHPNELKAALLSVGREGYYYSHDTTGKLASLFHKNHTNHMSIERSLLTASEIEFLKMASTDMTYKEIAERMNMTPRAVDGYRDTLFDKLEVKSRVGLAIYAVKNGIVTF